MLPIDSAFEKEDGTEENQKLIIHITLKIENPFTLIRLHYLASNDIFNYLIYYSTDYDKQGLAAYKPFDGYCLFEDDYVESLLTKTLESAGIHLYQLNQIYTSGCSLQFPFCFLWYNEKITQTIIAPLTTYSPRRF